MQAARRARLCSGGQSSVQVSGMRREREGSVASVLNTVIINGTAMPVFDLGTTARFWPQWHPASQANEVASSGRTAWRTILQHLRKPRPALHCPLLFSLAPYPLPHSTHRVSTASRCAFQNGTRRPEPQCQEAGETGKQDQAPYACLQSQKVGHET